MSNTKTVAEIAEFLGVHTDTVYTMVRQKEIPHIRLRRRILFRLDTIKEWLTEQEKNSYE